MIPPPCPPDDDSDWLVYAGFPQTLTGSGPFGEVIYSPVTIGATVPCAVITGLSGGDEQEMPIHARAINAGMMLFIGWFHGAWVDAPRIGDCAPPGLGDGCLFHAHCSTLRYDLCRVRAIFSLKIRSRSSIGAAMIKSR
ncbi:MAG: hypothetical protein JWQ98_1661 [Chlorobi bacterium]|nr:hypothetical protein [Chlorobiota bacterium]